jgi:hypothetical protein
MEYCPWLVLSYLTECRDVMCADVLTVERVFCGGLREEYLADVRVLELIMSH